MTWIAAQVGWAVILVALLAVMALCAWGLWVLLAHWHYITGGGDI